MRLAGRFAGGCFAGGGPLRSLLLRRGRATPQVVASRVAGRNVRSIFTLFFSCAAGIGVTSLCAGLLFLCQRSVLARLFFLAPSRATSVHLLHRNVFCASVASQRLLCICCIAASSAERQALPLRLPLRSIPPAAPPASNIFPMALRRSAPGRQHLPDGSQSQRPG